MDHLSNPPFASFVSHPAFPANGRPAQAPGAFGMDRRSRPMPTDLSSGRPYASAPRSGPGPGSGLDFHLGEIQSPAFQNPFQMRQFLEGDEPWSGMSGQQPASRALESSLFAYPNTRLPSDCGIGPGPGMLPSDSGYDSMARQSVANLSVAGEHDRSPDVLGLALSSFQPPPSPHGPNQGVLEYQREHWSQPPPTVHPDSAATNPTASTLVCPSCNVPVRTKCELNKHAARHNKPCRCEVPHCKSDGFATPNDLDRHRKSVHGAPGVRFRCQHDDKCRNKAKAWPRADNFKEHLKRAHRVRIGSDFDIEPYKWEDWGSENPALASIGVAPEQNPTFDPANVRTETNDEMFETDGADGGEPFRPDLELSFPSNDGSAIEPNFDEQAVTDTDLPPDADEPLKETAGDALQDFKVPTEVAGFDAEDVMSIDGEVDDQAPSQPYELSTHFERGTSLDGDMELTDDPPLLESGPSPRTRPQESIHGENARSPERPRSPIDTTEKIDPSNEAAAVAFIKRLEDKGLLQRLMEQHGYQKAKEPSVEPSRTAVPPPSQSSKTSSSGKTPSGGKKVTCEACGKSFPRKCELKKHMKRHEKPYGCTFPDCKGTFGSKNDWKRHENSQHFQLELWHCDENTKDPTSGECAKFHHRRETFKNHLKKCHGIEDSNALDEKANSCRTDCNRQTRFWCGFCRTIISNNKNGLIAWNERYNHIEAHLQGRGFEKKQMADWERGEEDSPETDSLTSGSGSVDGGGESSPRTTGDDAAATSHPADDLAMPHASIPQRRRATESDNTSPKRPRKGNRPNREGSSDNGGFWSCCNCTNFTGCKTSDSCFNCQSHDRCDNCQIEY